MTDLHPCPFCGSKALMLRVTETRWKAACLGMKCSAAMITDSSRDDCRDAWNQRATPAAALARAERAEPFFKLANAVIHPVNGERPWHADSADWMVVFSFAGESLTLGDLRKAAALKGDQA